MAALRRVRIVLVEPAGPRNVGAIARVMKNMGLQQLVLVNPQCDPLGEEARLMAVRGSDRLEAAQIVATIPEALQGCRRVIATTGREQTALNVPLEPPRACLPWLLAEPDSDTALIFGREDRGLSNAELNLAQRLLYIPAETEYESLNLAQAAGLCCYELRMACLEPGFQPGHNQREQMPRVQPGAIAPHDQREGFYRDLETLLLRIGYLYPHTAPSRMEKMRQILNRAYPSAKEMGMLRGVVSQVTWALGRSPTPPNVSPDQE